MPHKQNNYEAIDVGEILIARDGGIEALRNLFNHWFIEKNINAALSMVDEQVFIVGIFNIMATTKDELYESFYRTLPRIPEIRSVTLRLYARKDITPTLRHMVGYMSLRLPADEADYAIIYRFSALLSFKDDDIKIVNLHLSLSEEQPASPMQPVQLLQNMAYIAGHEHDNEGNQASRSSSFLRLLEDFYTTMVDGIAKISGREGYPLLFANKGFYNILGYTEAEFYKLTHNSIEQLLHPADIPTFLSCLRFISPANPRSSIKLRFRKKNFSWLWLRLDMTLSEDTDGKYSIFYCFCTDIDADEAKEKNYRQQNTFLSLLATEMDLGALSVYADENYPIAYLSENMVKFLGYTSKEDFDSADIQYCSQMIHAEDWPETRDRLDSQLQKGSSIESEFRVRKRDGGYRWILSKGHRTLDEDGRLIILFLWTDISRRKDMERDLHKKAQIDQLTGVYNRISSEDATESQLKDFREGSMSALFLIDLDFFKKVNDTYGHPAGDEVLMILAQILLRNSRETDITGRLGGDEFMLFMNHIKSTDFLKRKADTICQEVEEAFISRFPQTPISVSIGIAVASVPTTFDTLYDIADKTMYLSKDAGKNTWRLQHFNGELPGPDNYESPDTDTAQ